MQSWILIMIMFGSISNPSGISHVKVIKVYQIQEKCSEGIAKALSIKMPVAREFRCLKFTPIKHKIAKLEVL